MRKVESVLRYLLLEPETMKPWMVEKKDPYEDLIESVQPRLRGFVYSLVARRDSVEDIVQETNRVLWRKREVFEMGTNFWAWASRIAYFQVMAFRRQLSRDRLVFRDELANLMADEMAADATLPDSSSEALESCLAKLPDRQQVAIQHYYFQGDSLAEVALDLEIEENAASQLLFRARKNLRKCLSRPGLTPEVQ